MPTFRTEGYDLVQDTLESVFTNATTILYAPAGYRIHRVILWNQTATAGYIVSYGFYGKDTISVTGADVVYKTLLGVVANGENKSRAVLTSVAITGVTKGATTTIVTGGHGFPSGTAAKCYITGVTAEPVAGLDAASAALINGKEHAVTYVSATDFTIAVNTSSSVGNGTDGSLYPAASYFKGMWLRMGTAAPYAYAKIDSAVNNGTWGCSGPITADTAADIVTLPLPSVYPGAVRDLDCAPATGIIMKAAGGTCSVQAVLCCRRSL